jgi:hypothetical protein
MSTLTPFAADPDLRTMVDRISPLYRGCDETDEEEARVYAHRPPVSARDAAAVDRGVPQHRVHAGGARALTLTRCPRCMCLRFSTKHPLCRWCRRQILRWNPIAGVILLALTLGGCAAPRPYNPADWTCITSPPCSLQEAVRQGQINAVPMRGYGAPMAGYGVAPNAWSTIMTWY